MKIIAPDYYSRFSCLMGACRHSCCIGWEIDIDEESLARFKDTPGKIGDELRGSIIEEKGVASFRLAEDERCPFLNDGGLCRLILELGEDCLCQICADHPRYRSFFSDREEIGLGLCCEAAAQLILRNPEKAGCIVLEDDGTEESPDPYEQDLLHLREELTAILQNRSLPVMQRIRHMLDAAEIDIPGIDPAEWQDFFLSLERLDEAWTQKLKLLSMPATPLPQASKWEIAFEQLAVYMLHRHLPGAVYDDDITGRIAFVALMVQLLRHICGAQGCDLDGMIDLCRMFSSEIEYSDENIEAILSRLHETYPEI